MFNISVELSIQEKGKPERGYLRDNNVELEDLLRYTKSQLILISDEALTEEQHKGFDSKPLILVDGSKTKKASEVNPLGQIEFVARQDLSEILIAAYEALLQLSKVLTGRYKSSHYVYFDERQVATDESSLKSWLETNPEIKNNDIVRIVNVQPYGRRLELLGVTADRQQSRKVDKGKRKGQKTGILIKKPNGAYQLALRRIQSKYSKNVKISFSFIPGSQIGLTDRAKAHHFKNGKRANSVGRTYLYPSLVFKIDERGIF